MPRSTRAPRARLAPLVALVAVLGLVLSACSSSDPEKFSGNRLDTPYQVPDIELTDSTGAAYSLATDAKKDLTLVFFGYTSCPDYCPMVLNNLAAAMNRLDEADRSRVDVVFVTTDPTRDTPAELTKYLKKYDPDFVGLTGDLDAIIALGEPLHVYVNDGKLLPTGGYDLGGHSTFTLALADDEAVALWNQETSNTEFARDIHTLLTED